MAWIHHLTWASSLHSHPLMRLSRLVFLLFLVAQAADGICTYVAVTALGPGVERNFVLAIWMALVGPAPTLVVAKGVAVAAGVLVYRHGLHAVLAGLTAMYAVMAVGPWIHIFATWP
jgi:hypothetical protein